jgi:hypothetical protein
MSFPNLPAEYEDPWYTKFINWATSVQNRITGTETVANAAVPFKGSLSTQNLNAVMAPGMYRQPTAVNATAALNYPVDTQGGVLEVLAMDAGNLQVLQRWTPLDGIAGFPRGSYVRRGYGGAWSSWQFMPTQRVDATAGRAIYTWDHLNNREQLIYGDTGERSVSAIDEVNIPRVSVLTLRAARETFRCSMAGDFTLIAGTAGTTDLFAIPAGFTPTANFARIGTATLSDGTQTRAVSYNSSTGCAYIPSAPATGGQWLVNLNYRTNNTWPTALPGTASGTIPNA